MKLVILSARASSSLSFRTIRYSAVISGFPLVKLKNFTQSKFNVSKFSHIYSAKGVLGMLLYHC